MVQGVTNEEFRPKKQSQKQLENKSRNRTHTYLPFQDVNLNSALTHSSPLDVKFSSNSYLSFQEVNLNSAPTHSPPSGRASEVRAAVDETGGLMSWTGPISEQNSIYYIYIIMYYICTAETHAETTTTTNYKCQRNRLNPV